jgi:VanZ family protein
VRRYWYPALAYALLVIYASLYPLAGWHDTGASPFEFLDAGWPRYWTGFDLATNVIAYLPLGLTWFIALRQRLSIALAAVSVALIGGCLSFALEAVQAYLPTRIPSNLDLSCNMAGAALGVALGARWSTVLDSERWRNWRRTLLVPGETADIGLILMTGWLFAQLTPESLLFGSGNLRQLLDIPAEEPFLVERFAQIEAVIAAAGLLAAGLVGSLLLQQTSRLRTLGACCFLLLCAMLLKTLAHALLMAPAAALSWITPGNMTGLGLGLVLLTSASFTRMAVQRAIAALALLLATVLVNLAPENPYLANTLEVWNQGHFLNFNGLTRLLCSIWPFLALPWLMLYFPHDHAHDHQPD